MRGSNVRGGLVCVGGVVIGGWKRACLNVLNWGGVGGRDVIAAFLPLKCYDLLCLGWWLGACAIVVKRGV